MTTKDTFLKEALELSYPIFQTKSNFLYENEVDTSREYFLIGYQETKDKTLLPLFDYKELPIIDEITIIEE